MINGRAAALQNIHVPMFIVATERDHASPWRSVYTIHYHTDTDVTFVLTSGGHNTGIVRVPGHQGGHFRIAMTRTLDPCLDPDEWAAAAEPKDGSWWAAWADWLASHSARECVLPPLSGTLRFISAAAGSHRLISNPTTHAGTSARGRVLSLLPRVSVANNYNCLCHNQRRQTECTDDRPHVGSERGKVQQVGERRHIRWRHE